jgi:hypothetical protein
MPPLERLGLLEKALEPEEESERIGITEKHR